MTNLTANYNLKAIPAWVIRKACRAKYAEAACILSIDSGTACVVRETAKAILVEWHNTELECCKVCGGEFWVAKSLLG